MENGGFFNGLSSSEDIITLLQVSQSISSSTTSTEQSKSIESTSERLRNSSRNLNEEIDGISRGKWRRKFSKIGWNKYIRWDLLFTFGCILWIALCIADYVCPSTIYTIREIKLRTKRARNFDITWKYKFFSYFSYNVIPNLIETFMFVVFFGVIAVTESCMKKKWFNDSQTIRCNSIRLLPIYNEQDFEFDGLEESEDTYHNSEDLGELKYIKIEGERKLQIHPELYWQWKLFKRTAEITTRIKQKNKRLNKLGLHTSDFPARKLLKYDPVDESSFQSYETYDQEIHRFIMAQDNSSIKFDKIIIDLQKTKRTCPASTSSPQKINPRIISSSPAFKNFLSRLKINSPPCNKLTF
ncbi:uncharacterized protein [Fopius arisanus]|uniref:Uncharacterized protein n=1 Tax=Fopius arisanus TaxID=64838 RepID=A0A9R1U0A4_9HYME|nr:PREDICTED: uncharacterized protein LOC105266668 [Fopius arisanus]